MSIALFACGGTLDKDYDEISGKLDFHQSHLPLLLQQARHTLPLRLQTLMLKDSLDMDDRDREHIVQACQQAEEQHIVITHGTDTLTQTATRLAQQHAEHFADKTLVLTGAMRPFRLGDSDAGFNLGSALMAVQLQAPGVYICINGRCFLANQVSKDRRIGRFKQD